MKHKKRLVVLTILLFLALGFGLYGVISKDRTPTLVEDMPPIMVMVDRQLYQLTDTSTQPPDSPCTGIIQELIRIPSEDAQANFGKPGMPYWRTEDGVVVKLEENYLQFEIPSTD